MTTTLARRGGCLKKTARRVVVEVGVSVGAWEGSVQVCVITRIMSETFFIVLILHPRIFSRLKPAIKRTSIKERKEVFFFCLCKPVIHCVL